MQATRRDRSTYAAALALSLAGWPVSAEAQQSRYESAAPPPAPALAAITPRLIETHVRFLADDLLEGRAPGTRGGQLAAGYLAAQFATLGLAGGSADGTPYQWVPLVGLASDASIVVGAQRNTLVLEQGTDFVARPERADSIVSLDAPIVFLGYGIAAPQWGWDDYKGAAQTGRVVMVLANDPGVTDSAVFPGPPGTWYRSTRYKLEQAARMGAVGVLLIHTPGAEPFPWASIRDSWSGEQVLPDEPAQRSLRFAAWISVAAARRIVEATGKDYDLMVRRADTRAFSPIDVGARAAVDIRSRIRRFRSANVIAVIPGSDSLARQEAVVLSAHYDHLGIGKPEAGDSIYNGAVDNASGVSVLLAAATALARASRPPRRTVVFLATTGSEGGSLGARAYLSRPSVSLQRTAALINIDGANVWGPTTDIVADGAELSELDSSVIGAARAESLNVTPDPYAAFGDLYRSDQLPFARAGVPVVLLRPGTRWRDVEADPATKPSKNPWLAYLAERYHRPSDEVRPEFDYRGAVQQARLLARLVWLLAESAEFPRWRAGAEFGTPGRTLPARR